MSKNIKVSTGLAVPFFARFLSEQDTETGGPTSTDFPTAWTLKWPSDFEDS
ncbi:MULTISPECIES: microviridin/marinostatin family tricyclic proteinase inhibitor [Planktothrix]|uniref:microviridin/marinostatin family tricyclic proteinase inhibitor n=1 Tax=Planktothrix TaxID=54304 RepID=UPI0009DBA2F7|nr:MdnA protein [Planktothrix agardhii]CAD5973994.1 MdnA protein [Planktothrix agardhii]